MASMMPTVEGEIPFDVPGQYGPCTTYYKVFGDLTGSAPRVVVLHGGPGGGHEYLLSFAQLWPQYGLPVVFYDQIGCGASTHLPETAGDGNLWKESLFLAELDNLIDYLKLRDGPGFNLLGQSWGGMIGTTFAARRPLGLQRLILASAVASVELSSQAIDLCKSMLPLDAQNALSKGIEESNFESPAFKEAAKVFQQTFVFRAHEFPAELLEGLKHLNEDKTVYSTIYGPSVFQCNGSLSQAGWTSIPNLPRITAPTLVYNGEYDTSHNVTQQPFFDLIPRVRWITFTNGGHMCHLEPQLAERVLKVVGEFLTQDKHEVST